MQHLPETLHSETWHNQSWENTQVRDHMLAMFVKNASGKKVASHTMHGCTPVRHRTPAVFARSTAGTNLPWQCTKESTLVRSHMRAISAPRRLWWLETWRQMRERTLERNRTPATFVRNGLVKSSLTEHTWVHTGEKPFERRVSEKRFSFRSKATKRCTQVAHPTLAISVRKCTCDIKN